MTLKINLRKVMASITMFSFLLVTPALNISPAMAAQPQVEVQTVAAGTKYATPMYIIKSGQPGPVFMFTGGVHGNESAGYVAARRIAKEFQITRGTLIVIPDSNVLAIKAKKRYVSSEGDLNRQFPVKKGEQGKSVLSRALLDVAKKYNVQWHVDMHEGYDYYKSSKSSSVGQTIIYYPTRNSGTLANKLVGELNRGISESIRKFSVLKYPVGGSFARGTAVTLGSQSFIFETSQKQTLDVRVNFQLAMVKFFLREAGMQAPVKANAPAQAVAPIPETTSPVNDAEVPNAPDEEAVPSAPVQQVPAPNTSNSKNLQSIVSNPRTAVSNLTKLMGK